MKLILSPRDTLTKIELQGVETFCMEANTLLVIFTNGHSRNYPYIHLWYWESEVPAGKNRSKPPGG